MAWDFAPATGEFPVVAPEELSSTAAELTDARLQSLAALMDDERPSLAASLDELKNSWVERPPRGVAVTRDQSLALVGSGDGTFAVYRAGLAVRLLVGRLQVHGTAIILFEPDRIDGAYPRRSGQRLERLAAGWFPPRQAGGARRTSSCSPGSAIPSRSAPTAADSHIWHGNGNRLQILDLTTGRVCSTFDLGPLRDLRGDGFHTRWRRRSRLAEGIASSGSGICASAQSRDPPRTRSEGSMVGRFLARRPYARLGGRRPLYSALGPGDRPGNGRLARPRRARDARSLSHRTAGPWQVAASIEKARHPLGHGDASGNSCSGVTPLGPCGGCSAPMAELSPPAVMTRQS